MVPKKIWVTRNSSHENFWELKNFRLKKFQLTINLGSENLWDFMKRILVQKKSGSQNNIGPKKIWDSKYFWFQNIYSQKKKLGNKRLLGQVRFVSLCGFQTPSTHIPDTSNSTQVKNHASQLWDVPITYRISS